MKSTLLACLLCLSWQALAQDHQAVKAETVISDAGPEGTDQQVKENTARLDVQEKMTGTQDFILKLLGILVPAAVLMMQWRLSKQVNGMKDELVESVRKAALLQGAEAERKRPTAKRKKVKKT